MSQRRHFFLVKKVANHIPQPLGFGNVWDDGFIGDADEG